MAYFFIQIPGSFFEVQQYFRICFLRFNMAFYFVVITGIDTYIM